MKDKKKILLSILGILLLVLATIGVTYAVFTYTKLGTTENTVTTGTLKFLYTENTGVGNGINIENAFPVSDEVGKGYNTDKYVFDFSVEATNSGVEEIPYEVTLRKKNTSTLPESNVKVYLTDMTDDSDTSIVAPTLYSGLTQTTIDVGEEVEKTIYNGNVLGGELTYKKDFRLRMWIDEKSNQDDINGETFTALVNVYANANLINNNVTAYKEVLLNGADPVLESTTTLAKGDTEVVRIATNENNTKLIPVIIAEDGSVTKADINKKWYSYADKEWANAVILKDESITYENGATIPETNIESYFVWIPKYSYQLWDLGNYTGLTSNGNKEQEINIRFGLTNTSDSVSGECTTPAVAGASGNCTVGDYMTHPAFLSFNSNGMWVGKFETGYDGATSTAAAEVNGVATDKIIIKPNVYSWRNNTIGRCFELGYQYNRNLDSHMMKNTEWGAVAYLHHSNYGSATDIRFNNNKAFITGYASTEVPTKSYNNGTSISGNRNEETSLGVDGTYTVNYLNPLSKIASTTGNYSGIYDMSGGCWEYVMGSTSTTGGSSGITSIYNDFFTNSNWNKYYDKYSNTSSNKTAKNRILGDATGEMGPLYQATNTGGSIAYRNSWYKDTVSFVTSTYPWFGRGGQWQHGIEAGIFAYCSPTGNTPKHYGFRIVLTPTN